jgi:hypothetical protein
LSLDIDRLIKLIKLANNNPNDNEANLAARRVCKMIADNDYKFTTESPKSKPITYNGPIWESNPPSSNPDWFTDFFKNTQWRPKYTTYEHNPDDKKYYDRKKERGFHPGNEKRMLKCTKCGIFRSTIFVGRPEVFVCNDCRWTDI